MPSSQSALSPGRLFFRWFALTSALNLYLLHGALRRWHYSGPPMSHAMARVFFWAIAINVVAELLIGWFAIREGWRNRLSLVLKLDAAIGLLPFLMGKFFIGQDEARFRAFGTIYVVFLLLRLALGLAWFSWNAPEAQPVRHAGAYFFAFTFLVFGGCAPWIWLSSSPQGDEAHFLILTHSLAFDHDFDVGDNYDKGDYKEEFPPPSPGMFRGYPYALIQQAGIEYLPHEPHVVRNYRGQLMLEHDMGFPLLLMPAYAIDLREGALVTVGLVGAIGAALIFEMALLLGATNLRALLTVVLFCFTTPYWVYTQAAFLDIVGAVEILWVALQFFRYRKYERNRYLVLGGIVIAALPWLNIRYWSLAGPAFLVFSAWILRHEWGKWPSLIRKMGLLGAPCLVSLGIFAVIDKALFDTYLPNASMVILSRTWPQFQMQPIRGFLGMLFDQSYGLIPVAPLYIVVAAGMILLFRRDRWGFAALFLPALGYLPFVSSSKFWFGGWCAPGRFILSAIVIMIPTAALALTSRVRWLVGLLAAWSFLISVLFTLNSYLRMPSMWRIYEISMLVELFHDHIRTPFYSVLSIFPNFMIAARMDYVRGWLWLVFFAATAWWWAGVVQPKAASSGTRQK